MIRVPKPAFQRVEIFWEGATAGRGWTEPDIVTALDRRGTTSVVTLGYLVRVTAREVTIIRSRVDLSREHDSNARWDGVFTIPRSTIRKIVLR